MCIDQNCACRVPHKEHPMLNILAVEKCIRQSPPLPQLMLNADKVIQVILETFQLKVRKLKEIFDEHLSKVVLEEYKYENLRKKLLDGMALTAEEITGHNVSCMLDEINAAKEIKGYDSLKDQ